MTRWNPAHFGEVPRQMEPTGQLTIFWDDRVEPPDPDDYRTLLDYEQDWQSWLNDNPWYENTSLGAKGKGNEQSL